MKGKKNLPSVITHSVVGIAAGKVFTDKKLPWRFWILSVLCSLIPDADVIGYYLSVPYSHFFGHRGFFHSPFFALLLSILIVSIFFREEKLLSKSGGWYILYFFLVGASHGILDAFTNGGLGIALLSPFTNARYFSPWTPIQVSPLSIRAFFSEWGLRVILSELVWVCIPLFFFVILSKIGKKPGLFSSDHE